MRPGKARTLGFPGAGPAWPGAPPSSSPGSPAVAPHLALDLGLRPVGRGENVVRAAWLGAAARCPPQRPFLWSSEAPSGGRCQLTPSRLAPVHPSGPGSPGMLLA